MDSMVKPLDDVLREYYLIELDLENKIKEKLDKIRNDVANINKTYENSIVDSDWEKRNKLAIDRNKNLLKNLEQTKAKLRSLYYYQPAGENFISQINQYKTYLKRKYH